jgi:hypothetical protein
MQTIAQAAQTVVACPSCLTSYSVDASAVTASPNPKFHCSRCDSIFSMTDQALIASRTAATAVPAQVDEIVIEESVPAKRIEAPRASYSHSSAVKASDFSIGSRLNSASEQPARQQLPSERTRVADERETPTHVMSRSGISLLTAQDEAPEMEMEQEEFDTYQDATSAEVDEEILTPTHRPVSASITEKLFSQGFEITPPQQHRAAPTKAPTAAAPAPRFELTAPQALENERIDEETYRQALLEQRSILQKAWDRISPRNRGLITMSAPLAATLGLLLSLTPLASVSPHSLGALVDGVSPSVLSNPTPQTPPSSLAVKNLSLRFEKTQSQETIAVVTGSLVNTSNSKISGVNLEALAFNRRGEVAAASRAPLRSALAKENIGDLTLETVKKFQSSLNARSASIAPGESVPFSIALLDTPISETGNDGSLEIDLSQMKYFSARVFSVNQ